MQLHSWRPSSAKLAVPGSRSVSEPTTKSRTGPENLTTRISGTKGSALRIGRAILLKVHRAPTYALMEALRAADLVARLVIIELAPTLAIAHRVSVARTGRANRAYRTAMPVYVVAGRARNHPACAGSAFLPSWAISIRTALSTAGLTYPISAGIRPTRTHLPADPIATTADHLTGTRAGISVGQVGRHAYGRPVGAGNRPFRTWIVGRAGGSIVTADTFTITANLARTTGLSVRLISRFQASRGPTTTTRLS
jgi:hypothetical protein